MKTIEESKDRLFADYCDKNKDKVFNGFRSARYLHFSAGFDAAVNYILSLPLAQRLSEEERRELRCRYLTNQCVIRDHRKRTGDKAQTRAIARMKLLESIFGKEIFAKIETDNTKL